MNEIKKKQRWKIYDDYIYKHYLSEERKEKYYCDENGAKLKMTLNKNKTVKFTNNNINNKWCIQNIYIKN